MNTYYQKGIAPVVILIIIAVVGVGAAAVIVATNDSDDTENVEDQVVEDTNDTNEATSENNRPDTSEANHNDTKVDQNQTAAQAQTPQPTSTGSTETVVEGQDSAVGIGDTFIMRTGAHNIRIETSDLVSGYFAVDNVWGVVMELSGYKNVKKVDIVVSGLTPGQTYYKYVESETEFELVQANASGQYIMNNLDVKEEIEILIGFREYSE